MELTMVNNEKIEEMKRTLNSMKGKQTFIWQHGIISSPVLLFNDFNWSIEEVDNDEYLVLYDGEVRMMIFMDELYDIMSDELLMETVIYTSNELVLQIWSSI